MSSDQASPWVARFAPLISAGGKVLDLACGSGRHARLLAALGCDVLAADRDEGALARASGSGITTMQVDFEQGAAGNPTWPFPASWFDGIVVTNYLHRPLLPHIIGSLAPRGVLIYETFAAGNGRFGRPSNPDFLLQPGELLEVVRGAVPQPLQVIAFEDGYFDHPAPAMLQRICAVRHSPDFSAP